MPARLSPSPPVLPRVSNSPEAMSLTEVSRPVLETHLLHPTLPYMAHAPDPRNLREAPYSTLQMALPPLQTRQLNEPTYNAYRREPNLVLHPVRYSQQGPSAPLSRTSPPSHQPLSYSPANSRAWDQYAGIGRERHLETGSPASESAIKRDDSEEVSYFNQPLATLPSQSRKQASPAATVCRNTTVASQQRLHDLSLKGDISKQMGISSLISSNESSSSLMYDLVIRQQPIAARACGFGDRDRRVIDPPPILQMLVRDPAATPAELDTKMRYTFSVIHCELWNAVHDHEETAMPEISDRPPQRRLMGTMVSSPFVGRDEFGAEGCFFPFPDLSCRTTGKYRLKFVLVVLNPASIRAGTRLPFKATVLSNVFEVYPAKTFPGMVQSTELAKRLKEQGCLISVKKGHQRVEMTIEGRPSQDVEEEDREEDDEMEGSYREKRQKT